MYRTFRLNLSLINFHDDEFIRDYVVRIHFTLSIVIGDTYTTFLQEHFRSDR